MKKLILGIIAVFLIEIGFITYLNLDASADPAVAVFDDNITAPGRDQSILDEPNDVAESAGPDSRPGSGPQLRRVELKAAKAVTLRRRTVQRIRAATGRDQALSARAVPYRPRVRVARGPGFRTEIQREYFGRMVVEVTYRVYDFRPRNISRTKKGQYVA